MPDFPTPVRRKPAGIASITLDPRTGLASTSATHASGPRASPHSRTGHATLSGRMAVSRFGSVPIGRPAAANRTVYRHKARFLAAMGDPAVTPFGRKPWPSRQACRKCGAASGRSAIADRGSLDPPERRPPRAGQSGNSRSRVSSADLPGIHGTRITGAARMRRDARMRPDGGSEPGSRRIAASRDRTPLDDIASLSAFRAPASGAPGVEHTLRLKPPIPTSPSPSAPRRPVRPSPPPLRSAGRRDGRSVASCAHSNGRAAARPRVPARRS